MKFLKSEAVTSDTNLAIGCRCGSDRNNVELVPKTLNPQIKQEQEQRHPGESECLEMLLEYADQT